MGAGSSDASTLSRRGAEPSLRGTSCCLLSARPGRSLSNQPLLTSVLDAANDLQPDNVCIIGGGIVGLCLALQLAEFNRATTRPVNVTVYDRRWCQGEDLKVYWSAISADDESCQSPRDQVVPLRDAVVELFNCCTQATVSLFEGECVWPGSQNIYVPDLEKKLLARVQEDDVSRCIALKTVPPDIGDILVARDECGSVPDADLATYRNWVEARLLDTSTDPDSGLLAAAGLIIAADGADSLTRRAFADDFPWIFRGGKQAKKDEPESDFILSIALAGEEVVPARPRLLTAALSASQCRCWYVPDACFPGCLSIRITQHEFDMIVMQEARGRQMVSRPATRSMRWSGSFSIQRLLQCLPWLGSLVCDCTAMFGVEHMPIKSIVASHVEAGSSKTFHCIQSCGGVRICLVGDAAMAHHWPPGRDLNAGLKAAHTLALVLHKAAPLSAYGCFMQRLREQEVLWRLWAVPVNNVSEASSPTGQKAELLDAEAPGDSSKIEIEIFARRVQAWRDALSAMVGAETAEQSLCLSYEEIVQIIGETVSKSLLSVGGNCPTEPLAAPEVLPRGAFFTALNAWAEMSSGQLDDALSSCIDGLNTEPGDSLCLLVKSAVKLQMGCYEEAAYQEMSTTNGSVGALPSIIAAEAKLQLGRFKRAVKDCDKALTHEPNHPLAHMVRAQANHRLGNWACVIDDCDLAISSALGTLSSLSAYYLRAQAKLQLNRCEEAILDCDCVLVQGLSPFVLVVRAHANRRVGKFQIAISDCDKALQISPNFYDALSARGQTLLDFGHLASAVADLDRALSAARAEKMPASLREQREGSSLTESDAASVTAILTARADAMIRTGKPDEAINNCCEALVLDRANSLAYAIRAEAKLMTADCNGCIKDCSRALELQPQDPFTYVVRAEAHLHLDKVSEAILDCDKALGISPSLDYASVVREKAMAAYQRQNLVQRQVWQAPADEEIA